MNTLPFAPFHVLLLLALLSSLLLLVWRLFNSLWLKPRKMEKCLRDQGFQGNPYRSIYGDMPQASHMARSALSNPVPSLSNDIIPRILPFLHQLITQYGMKSFIWYGRYPRVNITEPEMIREIFTKWDMYHKENIKVRRVINGLALREGEEWRKIRRILNPAFHVDNLKCMLPMMQLSCDSMLSKWEELVAPKGSAEIDIWASLTTLTADVISRTAFGSSYEDGKILFKLQNEQLRLIFQSLQSVSTYIPGWRYMPTKRNQMIKQLDLEIHAIIMNLIMKRKESMKTGNYQYKNDLLGMMLQSNEQEMKEYGSGMSMEDVIHECRFFYLAGQDTTASLLTWTLILLSQHQDWQTKAREEVMQHFGRDKMPDFETLNRLKIMTMILNEILRLYPPVTSITRSIHQNTRLKDLSILDGMELSLPIVLLHRDTRFWGNDAIEFKPDRFAEGVSNASKVSGSFVPFGGGPRVCIGQNFALMEAKLALTRILQRFHSEMSPSYVHAPQCHVSMEPQFGAPLVLSMI